MLGWLKTTKLHFIGIGGIGMSGIAEVLLDLGHQVSGSDISSSAVTDRLKLKGATIYQGHHASNLKDATLVIYSSAIDPKNPEFSRAQELKIPLIRRAEMLAELMRLKFGIAVAGSHGKTTTTSLVATIFNEAQKDATYIIGGIVSNLGGNAQKGDGDFLIAEADESDGSFLLLNPIMAAITNIDDDHLDYYGSREKIVDAFVDFVNKLPFYGKVALNANDMNTLKVKERIKRSVIWYGIETNSSELDYAAQNVVIDAGGTSFDLYNHGTKLVNLKTPLWGLHNVANTLAAISICHQAGIDLTIIQKGLLKFRGVGRRLEKLYQLNDFMIIDDYGHHPTEVRATLSSLRSVDSRRICVVFEPHRFTRTQNFWKEFQDCFGDADEIFITPIYAASEDPIPGITSLKLVEEMRAKGINAQYLPGLDGMRELIEQRKDKKCLFVTLGAGAISKKIREFVKEL
jgi:UDP-N-acetylmuramate--alanine ligase